MKSLLFILLINISLLAQSLYLREGLVQAHTGIIMDSIDPVNMELKADLTIEDNDLTTLDGKFFVEMGMFISDNKDRDEHMMETLNIINFPKAIFTIDRVMKHSDKLYTLVGDMNFHGVKKELSFKTDILNTKNTITLTANSDINGTDFGLEMPCQFFICVDNKINIIVKAVLDK